MTEPEPSAAPEERADTTPAAPEADISAPIAPAPGTYRPSFDRPVVPDPTAPHPAFIAAARDAAQPSIQAQLGGAQPQAVNRMAAPDLPPDPVGSSTVSSCTSCGLSLSASARFCRRCGTRQHD
jgi:hypothetical protein